MSINKRTLTNGTFVYDVRYRDESGHQFKKTFPTKKDATQFNASLKLDQNNGTWIDPRNSKLTLSLYSQSWLGTRANLRIRTFELYRGLLVHHILPYLGKFEIGSISTQVVRLWYMRLGESGLSQPTVAKIYRLLRTMLNSAIEDGLIKSNPCSIKGAGSERSPERPVASIEEVFKLADAIGDKYRLTVLLATFGGLRLGEILALTKESFDLDSNTITISKQLQELANGEYYFGEPKSDAGRRSIALPDFMADEISSHFSKFTGTNETPLIFTSDGVNPLRRGVLFRAWKKARTEVGVDHLHFHDLRHTGNTLAAATGASTAELMARMGHSSSEAALRYQHASKERDIVIASKLNAIVENRIKS